MIRRLRYALTIVRDISMILCPASTFVRARVDEAHEAKVAAEWADLLAEREEHVDVMEPWRFGPVQPAFMDEPDNVAELVRYHHVKANQADGVYCHCGHRSHTDRRHAHHVAGLVEDMIATDVRLANKQ
ncbi:hypothetical protein [Mycolicibacterium llatzerense]|uniref:hypothetical protein n=1 Tax=Mycolicibacterium llatzerense TaxID=280871 RepID=UPI0021B66DE6|nr:hypothetical protein [Mycolicibacterium llatzerense]MCT7364045.1 hypothetical protein [Mycolicibacterium llatzerense]